MTTPLTFSLSSLTFEQLEDEARHAAEADFPGWDFDNPSDIAKFVMSVYLKALIQKQEITNGWVQEAFLPSCRLRSSALAHAEKLGYQVQNPTPGIVSMDVVFVAVSGPRTIPQYSIILSTRNVNSSAPIFFENAASFVISSMATLVTTDFVAGRSFGVTYTGTGAPDQSLTLQESPVIDGSARFVDDLANTWTWVEDFVLSGPTDYHFITRLDSSGKTEVTFGDGSNGRAVGSGRVLAGLYRVGGGTNTNVIPHTVRTVEASSAVIASVDHAGRGVGGLDEESLEHIKKSAPAANRQRDTLAQIVEVREFCERYPGVSRAFPQLLGSSVIVPIVPVGGGAPSGSLKTALQAALTTRVIMGYYPTVVDPTYVTAVISVEFTTRTGYDSAEMETLIAAELLRRLDPTAYTVVDGVPAFYRDFGQPFRVNNVREVLASFAADQAIADDYAVALPAADVLLAASSIFTNVGSTVTATSRNVIRVTYRPR